MSDQATRPLYFIHLHAAQCTYEVRLNDCPILLEEQGLPVVVDIPINPWMQNGLNTLTLVCPEETRPGSKCQLQVFCKELGDEYRAFVTQLSLEDLPRRQRDGLSFRELPFSARVPFPAWRWLQTPPIQFTREDQERLMSAIVDIWQTMANKNIERFKQLLREKSDETRHARYQTMQQREAELSSQFEQLFTEEELQPLDLDDIEIIAYAERRLLRVLDSTTRESPIFFLDKEKQLATYLDLIFYKNLSGDWILIR